MKTYVCHYVYFYISTYIFIYPFIYIYLTIYPPSRHFQIIEDFQQKALQQGSEDPQSAETLQKCEEYLPGQVGVLPRTVRSTSQDGLEYLPGQV